MAPASKLIPLIKPSTIRPIVRSPTSPLHQSRTAATVQVQKRAGDISDAFASLSGGTPVPLEPRYASVKRDLIAGHEEAVEESWLRLLAQLRKEVAEIAGLGSKIVPEISYSDVKNGTATPAFSVAYKERGVCVVRGVVSREEALEYKASIRNYVKRNPHTKAFPANNPQVYELYWTEAQLKARSHKNLLDTQRYLMSFWHANPDVPISMQHPVSYADRLRMRQPGDASFALGPHIDGGSVERWEREGYGLGGDGKGVYGKIFDGHWEQYDAWDAAARLGVVSDMYGGVGACGIFRMAQGWLSMSDVKAGEGHLLVNPMLKAATAYALLRPFFEPKRAVDQVNGEEYLAPENWRMETNPTVSCSSSSSTYDRFTNDSLLASDSRRNPRPRPGAQRHPPSASPARKEHGAHADSKPRRLRGLALRHNPRR
jgi:hypothetical protein